MGRDGEEDRDNIFVSLVRTSVFRCGETGASQGSAAKRGLVDLAPCTPCIGKTGASQNGVHSVQTGTDYLTPRGSPMFCLT